MIPVTAANGRTGRSVVRALVRASFGFLTAPRRTREACSRPTPACP